MNAAPTTPFRAYVAEQRDDAVDRGVRDLDPDELPEGDVTVRVSYSSVNYKDALATIAGGKVARTSPLVPGIDLVGEVVASAAEEVAEGSRVIVHGHDLGVAHHGGFAMYARVPAGWVVPLPESMTERDAMGLGTAGFTAGLCVLELEEWGVAPDDGPVLVTGASGGVGSAAVGILAARGYEVVGSTGSADAADYLRGLGAADVVDREETSAASRRPLERERWAGAVDAVGGATLAYVLRTLRRAGAVAACGNAGGAALETTVLPFILRGVALLGADSAYCPIERRIDVWERLAGDYRPRGLDDVVTEEVGLDDLEGVLDAILAGDTRGRVLVRPDR